MDKKEYKKIRREINIDKVRKTSREFYHKNKEYRDAYRQTDKYKSKLQEWRDNNKEYQNEYYAKNKEKMAAKAKARYQAKKAALKI